MRVARTVQAGRGQAPLLLYAANSIYRRKLASNATLASDQTPALKLANQCNYSNSNYSYNGSPAPSFYGYSGTGWGPYNYGFQTAIDYTVAPYTLYIVDGSVPTQTITYVNYSDPYTYTVRSAGASNNLQSYFNAVPVPDVTKIPQGQIWPVGTDRVVTIWRPSTNELWEMWRMYGSPGSYVFGYGGYTNNATGFNGIWPNFWGTSACSLDINAGMLSIQDVIDVLHGEAINHAIGFTISVTAPAYVPPATRYDSQSVTPQYLPDGITPNPAYGFVDGVAEGTWLRFPANFNPTTAMPGAGPIALAIATAIRDYGLFVHDGGGNCAIKLEDARTLGSPYSYAKVNPFAGSTGAAVGFYDSYINNNVSAGWTDSTLPKVTEVFHSNPNLLSQIPWQQLQVLQPFSS
jgi:hypothetical protein